MTTGGPHLQLPDGWLLDEAGAARLARLLDDAPEEVVGVVARWSPLPPGTSHRVYNEHLALEAEFGFTVTDEVPAPAAVLTREPEAVAVLDDRIRADDGVLMVAHGVRAHDPAVAVESLRPAVSLGRSPFPWRPLVVVLGFGPTETVGAWAAQMTNDLLDHDLESRLAVEDHWGRHHLTGPCLPCLETLTALAPDVIVALDDRAEELARSHAAPSAWTMVLRIDGDSDDVEPLAWSEHPLRARAGLGVTAQNLATAVRTLCAEPHPLARSTSPGAAVALRGVRSLQSVASDRRLPSRRRQVHLVVGGVLDPLGRAQLASLGEFVTQVGDRVRTLEPGTTDGTEASDDDIPDVALVTVGSRSVPPTPLVSRRGTSGGSAALITSSEVSLEPDGHGTLLASAVQAAHSLGRAVTTGRGTAELLRAEGVPAFELPWLIARDRRDALVRVGRARRPGGVAPIIGWTTGAANHAAPEWAPFAASAVIALLDEIPHLQVEIVGDPMTLPAPLLQHPRVAPLPTPAHPTDLARWAVHLWSPSPGQVEYLGAVAPFVECSLASVPSVLDGSTAALMGHHQALGPCAVDDPTPDAWRQPLHSLLTDRSARAWQVRRTDEVVTPSHDSGACAATVARMLDWVESGR